MSEQRLWTNFPLNNLIGMKQLPPGQFSFNKDEAYVNGLNEDYQILVNNENLEHHGAPYWVSDVQREVTHSGESPLFSNKLLATGKFEQQHGFVDFERALLRSRTKRVSSPKRRHLNGIRQYYRPNSTHQYLSATDLRNMQESEEGMIKYGRPTRTTLLRARQRSNSAPINAYDLRRENTKRIEEVKNNTVFCTSKDSFEREQTRISYRFLNIYATDGETMHSFLTGARYNRAHLLDSKGLTVYGVYMPRENPTDCFITAKGRAREAGDEIPSAPPDSPRSDLEESMASPIVTRPMSGVVHYRPGPPRPASSKTASKPTSSRPQSNRVTSSKNPGSRPRSGKESIASSSGPGTRSLPPKSSDSVRKEPLPDEITMAMPDHINKTGRGGVYVTLKGQKMLETVESKLPRVTGVSLPKLRKPRDPMEEMAMVNQPPPTPVEASTAGVDKPRAQSLNTDDHEDHAETPGAKQTTTDKDDNKHNEEIAETQNGDVPHVDTAVPVNTPKDKDKKDAIDLNISKVTVSKNDIIDRKTLEIGPMKHVNFSENEATVIESARGDGEGDQVISDDGKKAAQSDTAENNDKVVFFVTEDAEDTPRDEKKAQDNALESPTKAKENNVDESENETGDKSVDQVIKVEISETDKTQ